MNRFLTGWQCVCPVGLVEFEVVVRAVKYFGFTANNFALCLQVFGQAVEPTQLIAPSWQGARRIDGLKKGIVEHITQLVMAQVLSNGYALEFGHRVDDAVVGRVKGDVQRQRRTILALRQGVGGHNIIREHGDFVARHVDGRHAFTRDMVNRVIGGNRETRRSDVHTQGHLRRTQASDGQGIVDFRRIRVVY